VNAAALDWPFDPALGVDEQNSAYAFWYQEERNEMMQYTGESMYAFVRDGGVWEDRSDLLDDHVGHDGDIFVEAWGDATYAWCEEGDGYRQVWLASTYAPGVAAPQSPASAPLLAAYPNPFNPRTEISFVLDQDAELSLSLFDVSGRRLCRRELGFVAAGRHSLPFEAVDDAGRPLASGVYLLRMEPSAGRAAEIKLALLR
jgi:hypothetical protein